MEDLDALAIEVVDTVQAAAGTFPGKRVLHAKGTSAVGTFEASGDAGVLTTAAHLQAGAELAAIVRFSNGGTDPASPDNEVGGRGMAVKLKFADGSGRFDLVGLTLPAFTVATPAQFMDFLRARATPEALDAFIAEHPTTAKVLGMAMAMGLPTSFATARYNGIHTFVLVDAAGEERPYRFRWIPASGVSSLDDAAAAGRDYLVDELAARLAAGPVCSGPVCFGLELELANPGDPLEDPSAMWEGEHETVDAGTLILTSIHPDTATAEAYIYDPTHVPEGIRCSADPILAFRPLVYGESYTRRMHPPSL